MSWMSLLSPLRWTRRSAATKSPLRGRGSSLLRSAVFTLSIIYFRFDFIVMGSVHINVPVKQKCSAYHVTRDFCYITRHFKLSLLFPYSVCGCSLTPSTENTAMCVWAPVKARSGFRGLNTHTHTENQISVFVDWVLTFAPLWIRVTVFITDLWDVHHNVKRVHFNLCS